MRLNENKSSGRMNSGATV